MHLFFVATDRLEYKRRGVDSIVLSILLHTPASHTSYTHFHGFPASSFEISQHNDVLQR